VKERHLDGPPPGVAGDQVLGRVLRSVVTSGRP
jgi:hypothetical protein